MNAQPAQQIPGIYHRKIGDIVVTAVSDHRPERRQKLRELDGLKSLYSDAYYSRDEFDELYGGEDYRTVKKTYDPDSRFLDLYAKAVQRR